MFYTELKDKTSQLCFWKRLAIYTGINGCIVFLSVFVPEWIILNFELIENSIVN